MKEWLLKIRENSGEIGRLALEAMETRTRRWRSRREKEPLLRMSRVGSAVELVTYEKIECTSLIHILKLLAHPLVVNVLDNERLSVDFKPLYQCIHIYTALDSLDELQRSYQADRKVRLIYSKIVRLLRQKIDSIRLDTADTAPARVSLSCDARDFRLLHRRDACTRNHWNIQIRKRSRRTMGGCCGASNHCCPKCSPHRN